jgi:hypothetical protein
MLTSAFDIITDAMRECGALGAVDQPDGNDARDGVRKLNDILEDATLNRMMTPALLEQSLTWPAFASSRGIGEVTPLPPNTYNLPRPMRIEEASYINPGSTSEIKLKVLQQDEFIKIRDKENQGTPRYLYYRPDFPQGTIFLTNVPVQTITLKIWYVRAFALFANPQTQIQLLPGYRRWLKYTLAVEMSPQWTRREASPTLQRLAQKSMANIKHQNIQALHLPQDPNFPTQLTQRAGALSADVRLGDDL